MDFSNPNYWVQTSLVCAVLSTYITLISSHESKTLRHKIESAISEPLIATPLVTSSTSKVNAAATRATWLFRSENRYLTGREMRALGPDEQKYVFWCSMNRAAAFMSALATTLSLVLFFIIDVPGGAVVPVLAIIVGGVLITPLLLSLMVIVIRSARWVRALVP